MRNRIHKLLFVVLAIIIVLSISAVAFAQSDTAKLTLSTVPHVGAGDSFEIDTAFSEEIAANAIVLHYTWNSALFDYEGFTAANGVTPISTEPAPGSVKITLMTPNYDVTKVGKITLCANSISFGDGLTYRLDYTPVQVARFAAANTEKKATGSFCVCRIGQGKE